MTYTLHWFLSRSLSTPPSSPSDGDTYLVAAGGTGAWVGEDGQIAQWQVSLWVFVAPYTGLISYVVDEQIQIAYDGAAWTDFAGINALADVPLFSTGAGIVISSSSNTIPLIALDNAGNSGAETVLLDHDPTALDPDAAHFYLNCATFPGINAPVSSRNDTVWTFGYNIAPGGGRVNSAEPALALHWENCYNQGGVNPDAAMEWHLQFSGTDGVVGRRPMTLFLHRDGSYAQLAWQFTEANLYDWAGAQRIKFDFTNPAISQVSFPLATTLNFGANNTATLRQMNAAGTANVTLLQLDAADTINLGTNAQVLGDFAATGDIVGPAFLPNGGGVPSLGMYGPGGELGFAVGGAEVMHVAAGAVGIGTATPDATLTLNKTGGASAIAVPAYTGLHLIGDAASNHLVLVESYGTAPSYQARVAGGTVATPTAVTPGTVLINLAGMGFDGTTFATGGVLNFFTDETWSTSAHGSRWTMRVTPIGGLFAGDTFFGYGDGRFGATGARFDKSYSRQAPSTAFSITIADACERLILDPAGTLATGTVTMPAGPKDGQICNISSSQIVTALTHLANTGQTLNGALTTVTANGFAEYTYVASVTTWYRTG